MADKAPSRRQVQTVLRAIESLTEVTDDMRKSLHAMVDSLKTYPAGGDSAAEDSETGSESPSQPVGGNESPGTTAKRGK